MTLEYLTWIKLKEDKNITVGMNLWEEERIAEFDKYKKLGWFDEQ